MKREGRKHENGPCFGWIQEKSGLSKEEMMRVFNCGYGMLVVVAPENEQRLVRVRGYIGNVIGRVV